MEQNFKTKIKRKKGLLTTFCSILLFELRREEKPKIKGLEQKWMLYQNLLIISFYITFIYSWLVSLTQVASGAKHLKYKTNTVGCI